MNIFKKRYKLFASHSNDFENKIDTILSFNTEKDIQKHFNYWSSIKDGYWYMWFVDNFNNFKILDTKTLKFKEYKIYRDFDYNSKLTYNFVIEKFREFKKE